MKTVTSLRCRYSIEYKDWIEQIFYSKLIATEHMFFQKELFTYHRVKKEWSHAEAECQKEGGHLASVLSEVVNDKLNDGIKYFWLGGRRESGEWRWSDNSSWGFTNWRKEYNTPTGDVCLYSHGYWEGRRCSETNHFKCKAD